MASIGVVVAVIENQNILLGLHDEPGGWGMPGGPVFSGESPVQAAVRYGQEQTGCRVELQKRVGGYSQLNRNGKDVHEVWFTASISGRYSTGGSCSVKPVRQVVEGE